MTYFHRCPPTIIGAKAFHCPVRDGKEWVHLAMVVKHNWLRSSARPRGDLVLDRQFGRSTLRVHPATRCIVADSLAAARRAVVAFNCVGYTHDHYVPLRYSARL